MEVNSSNDRIVVGVDGSAPADAALSWAGAEAARRGGSVVAVWVAPLMATMAGAGDPNFVAEYEDLLHRAVDRAGLPGVSVTSRVRCGYPDVELEDEVRLQGASMLVVGRRGTSPARPRPRRLREQRVGAEPAPTPRHRPGIAPDVRRS